MIKNVGIDTGVAMLLGMTEDDAARVLADCPPKLGGELLQGIAAVRPATAAFGPQAAAPLGLYGIAVLIWGTAAAGTLRARAG